MMKNPLKKIVLEKVEKALDDGDCKSAYSLLLPLIEEKYPPALYLYSTFSISEVESDADFDKRRIRLLQIASADGYAPAIFALAECYEFGDLVDKDIVRASALYRNAAEAGFSKAKLIHGLDLFYGSNEIQKDEKQGLALIKQAAEESVDGATEALEQVDQK